MLSSLVSIYLVSYIEVELRVSNFYQAGTHFLSTAPRPFLALDISQFRSHIFVIGLSSDHDPPAYTLCIAGIKDIHPNDWLVC
jgi:hypothetical protein